MNRGVAIIGDSISYYYTPVVKELLAGKDLVVERVGGGDSAALLTGLPEWLGSRSVDLVQFNCGLHDARFFRSAQAYQQPLNSYHVLLRGVVKWLQANTHAKLLWASTTPVLTERIKSEYVRFAEDIVRYNTVAKTIMDEAGIPINDLHAAVLDDSAEECLGEDGVHMAPRGNRVLAEAVTRGIQAELA